MSELYQVSSNPHVRSRTTTESIMTLVILSLLPAVGYGIYHFGPRAGLVLLTTTLSSVMAEAFVGLCRKKMTINDMSAVVTGILLGMNLPVGIPLWMAAMGAVFAIVIAKMLFGGLGQNFVNPALAARCFLLISFPQQMTDFSYGTVTTDAITGATPLALLKAGNNVNITDMIIGNVGGTIGETSVIALAVGACILLLCGVIDLKIPACYLLSFAMFTLLFGGQGFSLPFLVAQLSGGGLMLGAFFMATDYVTRPVTVKGQYLYGIILGILTGVFRFFGPNAEGVSYAILLGNLLVPLIEKVTSPTAFGWEGK